VAMEASAEEKMIKYLCQVLPQEFLLEVFEPCLLLIWFWSLDFQELHLEREQPWVRRWAGLHTQARSMGNRHLALEKDLQSQSN
jgi:hypothetical protein